MEAGHLFTLIKSCGQFAIPYDFYISTYPMAIGANQAKIGEATDLDLYRTDWRSAALFCNQLSIENNLATTYIEEENGEIDSSISVNTLTQESFRLPTPLEWAYAAHGWNGAKKGDYFPIQKEHFKIPFIDYPTTEKQKILFEQGYSKFEDLIPNSIGIFGMLAYAREWCAPMDPHTNSSGKIIRWEEYYTNYDNDIGYQTTTRDSTGEERLPFRVVLPCRRS